MIVWFLLLEACWLPVLWVGSTILASQRRDRRQPHDESRLRRFAARPKRPRLSQAGKAGSRGGHATARVLHGTPRRGVDCRAEPCARAATSEEDSDRDSSTSRQR